MIRKCQLDDIQRMYFIVNEAAKAYDGVIPADCYRQPYMSLDELKLEMKRVTFFGWEVNGELVGIMGIEPIKDVTLIRHAYVLSRFQHQGIGSKLLSHIRSLAINSPIMVGTWANAQWAIAFYQKHGFELLPHKDKLLKTYWDIPSRQIETSVVMGINVRQDTKE